jgi:hypothetical protein
MGCEIGFELGSFFLTAEIAENDIQVLKNCLLARFDLLVPAGTIRIIP